MTAEHHTAEFPADVQRRLYELMMLMKSADDRLSKGIATGEFMCVYWPSRGQEAIAAGFQLSYQDDHAQLAAELPVYEALYAYCRQRVKASG